MVLLLVGDLHRRAVEMIEQCSVGEAVQQVLDAAGTAFPAGQEQRSLALFVEARGGGEEGGERDNCFI